MVPNLSPIFNFDPPLKLLMNLVLLFYPITQFWSPSPELHVDYYKKCWLSRVTFLLDDDYHASCFDWPMTTRMHFIFHGFDIQSKYDTWQSSSNKNVTHDSHCNNQRPILDWGTKIVWLDKIGGQNSPDKLGYKKSNFAYILTNWC